MTSIHYDPNATYEMKLAAAGEAMLAAGFAQAVAADKGARAVYLRLREADVPRPAAGKLPYTEHVSAHELARQGDYLGASIASARRTNDDIARDLHALLVHTADELDRAARSLENGRRQYVLNRSSWHTDVTVKTDALDRSADAIDDLMGLRSYESDPSVEAQALLLERAADTLDAEIVRMGLKGDHPESRKLRAEAHRMRIREETKRDQAREARARNERARAVALARKPLGKREGDWLAGLQENPNKNVWGTAERNTVAKLIERGFIAKGTTGTPYVITDAGRDALERERAAATS